MIDAEIALEGAGGRRTVRLETYLTPDAEERAHAQEYAWIKALRHAPVDGQRFRERFTARGDSLWWFSELYLHKTRVVFDLHRTVAALKALLEVERPSRMTVARGSLAVRHVAAALGHGEQISSWTWRRRLASLDLHARRLWLAGQLSPERVRSVPRAAAPAVAAFVHRAFWKQGAHDGSAEAYIGPVLQDLETRLSANAIRYVGIGPATNFRIHRGLPTRDDRKGVIPVERFASRRQLETSRQIWRDRYSNFRRVIASQAMRDAARIWNVDCWPVVREQFAGIAWLQWPWSVRAMDEAAAALDALEPHCTLTYAEAGGWGRALVLEARRRNIPSVGLQHGFIYRTWLNYRHEPDEMAGPTGFPHPTLTLLFDDYAATHLREAGRFPPTALSVTGSPRLDALRAELAALPATAVAAARAQARLAGNEVFVLVATKEREARRVLPPVVAAAGTLPGVVLVIKPHPAETAAAYASVAGGAPHVRVLEPAAPLAPLLAAARAVITVNSTVALDAGVLGIPALAIGLPNNLTPFVEQGAIAGTLRPAELPGLLQRILYDEKFRQQLAARRAVMLGSAAAAADGRSATRSAEAIEDLLRHAPRA